MRRILFLMDSGYLGSEDDDPPCMHDLHIIIVRWFPVFSLQKIFEQKLNYE